jgi:hypothetical protein
MSTVEELKKIQKRKFAPVPKENMLQDCKKSSIVSESRAAAIIASLAVSFLLLFPTANGAFR